jgi:hypothetical protein
MASAVEPEEGMRPLLLHWKWEKTKKAIWLHLIQVMASRNRISMSGLHKLLYILSCYHYNIQQHLRKILITVSFTTHLSMCPSSTRKNSTSNLRSRSSSDNRRAWRLDNGSPRCVAAFVERLLMNLPSGNPTWLHGLLENSPANNHW